ncbi:MAG: hypothetical protein ACLRMZ_08345 [Blautia marasmi]
MIFMILTGLRTWPRNFGSLGTKIFGIFPPFVLGGGDCASGENPMEVGVGFSFRGWDKYYWLSTETEIPRELWGKEVLGLFDFGALAGTGNNGNFESLSI